MEKTGPITQLSAITLHTADMARSVAFYDALGFTILYGGSEELFTSYRIGEGFLNLQLDTAADATHLRWGRVVFYVTDVDAMYAACLAANIAPLNEPDNAVWGERYFHVHDPDGHELSFAKPL